MAQTQTESLVHLDPSTVRAVDSTNSRFGLKQTRLDSLKQSVVEVGGILQPVEVRKLAKPENGYLYDLTSGFYRHRVALELNKEQNAGLTLPAIVRDAVDDKARLFHQLTENMERENQSPMDQAVAIRKLMDAGVPKGEIRRLFARAGGKKGNQLLPASNAWVNIIVRLLDMPKAIQEKIHDGRVGFNAAYELGKVSPDKRADVLARAESERLAIIEREEKDEEKYLAAEKKATEAAEAAKAVAAEAETLKVEAEKAKALLDEKRKALRVIEKTPLGEAQGAEKEAIMESLKSAQTDVKAAEKVHKDTANQLAKTLEKVTKATETAEEQKMRLAEARKAQKPKGKAKAVTDSDIRKAAKAEGEETGIVMLSASEMRQAIKDVAKAEYPRVAAIAAAIQGCFNSKTTPKMLIEDLAVLTGEKKAAKK